MVISQKCTIFAVNLRKEEIMKSKVLIQLVCVLCCICMVSCKWKKTTTTPNDIYLYAPNNKVTVDYRKADYPSNQKPTSTPNTEVVSDNDVHELESVVEHYTERVPDEPVLPEEEYYFHLTAADKAEYYVYIHGWVTINGKYGHIMDFCKLYYSPEKVFKAIKEQAPDKILCISSTEEQIVKGSYFLSSFNKPPKITITNE